MTHTKRWTWPLAGLLALIAGLLAFVPAAQSVQTTAIHVSTFERRLDGYSGTADSRVTLSRQGVGRDGSRAMALRVLRPGKATAQARRSVGAHAVGTGYLVHGWTRASARRTVALVVQEVKSGRVVQTRRMRMVAGPKVWRQLRVGITTQSRDSVLRLRIHSPKLRVRDRVLVDNLRVTGLYSKTPATTPAPPSPTSGTCTQTVRGIPNCGAFVGAAHGSNTDPATLETQLGQRLGVRRTYFTASGVDKAVAIAKADLAAGRLPWISFKLPYSWKDMAAGRGDAWARDLAKRLAALGGPVWIAFHHEPEGDGDIQEWRRMQEHLAPLVRGTAPNVAYTVVMTGWNQFYGAAKYRLSEIWPRGVTIDLAGFDIYQQYGVVKNGTTTTKWTNFDDYFGKIATWARTVGVQWGLGETGLTDAAVASRPAEMSDNVTRMEAWGGVAYSYFDTTLNSVANWSLSTTQKRAAFARALDGSPRLN